MPLRKALQTADFTPYVIARFWQMVEVNGSKYDCWNWKGWNVEGRGAITINKKNWYAPRVAWQMFYGDPGIMFVCHKCDNPACDRPDHLFLGTNAENQIDAAMKLRKNNKLTPDDVREIRRICVPEHPDFGYSGLARRYRVNPASIWNIVKGLRWKHVA